MHFRRNIRRLASKVKLILSSSPSRASSPSVQELFGGVIAGPAPPGSVEVTSSTEYTVVSTSSLPHSTHILTLS